MPVRVPARRGCHAARADGARSAWWSPARPAPCHAAAERVRTSPATSSPPSTPWDGSPRGPGPTTRARSTCAVARCSGYVSAEVVAKPGRPRGGLETPRGRAHAEGLHRLGGARQQLGARRQREAHTVPEQHLVRPLPRLAEGLSAAGAASVGGAHPTRGAAFATRVRPAPETAAGRRGRRPSRAGRGARPRAGAPARGRATGSRVLVRVHRAAEGDHGLVAGELALRLREDGPRIQLEARGLQGRAERPDRHARLVHDQEDAGLPSPAITRSRLVARVDLPRSLRSRSVTC